MRFSGSDHIESLRASMAGLLYVDEQPLCELKSLSPLPWCYSTSHDARQAIRQAALQDLLDHLVTFVRQLLAQENRTLCCSFPLASNLSTPSRWTVYASAQVRHMVGLYLTLKLNTNPKPKPNP